MEATRYFQCLCISRLRSRGRDADDGYLRRHIVPPADDLGRESWVELAAMSGGPIFHSQVGVWERRWWLRADGVVWDRLVRWIFRLQGCSCE